MLIFGLSTRTADGGDIQHRPSQQNFSVDYKGRDSITGTERRRWHPAGISRSAAEAIKVRVDQARPRESSNQPEATASSTNTRTLRDQATTSFGRPQASIGS